ncbi:hypothetical protein Tco_0606139 [Tanacetum coccineum]
MITSRTVVDNNGNPLHMGNPFHVTGSFNNSINSMSHSHHIRGFTSTNNTTNSSQNALQRRSPQTFISSRTVVDNNGNLKSDNLENTVDMTGVNNTFVTSIPYSTRSRRIASANNATYRNLYRNAQQHRRMFKYWDCGDVVHQCPHCAAMLCEGKVQLPYLEHPPQLLQELMDYSGGQCSKLFRKHIKLLCLVFSFTSTGGKINKEINNCGAPYTFQLNGQNHHKIRTLLPTHEDDHPRLTSSPEDVMLQMLVRDLITMLNQYNPLVQAFRMARDRFSVASMQPVTLCLIGTRQRNARQYNLPTASEVDALVPGDGNPTDSRDVIVEERGARKVEIL